MQQEWTLLAWRTRVISYRPTDFIKTGEVLSISWYHCGLRSTREHFPFLLNLFGAWPCISLQAFVCFPCCPQPEDTICCISFHQQSAIPQPEVGSSRFWLYRRNPFPSNPRILRHVVLRPCYVSSTWSTMAKNTCYNLKPVHHFVVSRIRTGFLTKNSRLSFTYQILNNLFVRLFHYNKLCARGFTKSLRGGKFQSGIFLMRLRHQLETMKWCEDIPRPSSLVVRSRSPYMEILRTVRLSKQSSSNLQNILYAYIILLKYLHQWAIIRRIRRRRSIPN